MLQDLLALDTRIYLFVVHELRVPTLDILMPVFSLLGNFPSVWPFLFLAIAVLGGSRGRAVAVVGIFALALTLLASEFIIKELFARPRPFETYMDIELLVPPAMDFSFPSTHAATSFAAAIVIWWSYLHPLVRTTVLILAILISCSRVYVGVHYPLDILSGAVLGVFIAGLALHIMAITSKRKKRDP